MNDHIDGARGPVVIEKFSLHDQVVSQIRDMIIEGYLEPGTRIDEVGLAARLGVSRTPFREALRTLAAEGLIVSHKTKGRIVRKLTPEDVHATLELLGHIELLAGRLACERASAQQITDLLDLHERMLERWQVRDRLPYYKMNQEFHTRLSSCSGNSALIEMQANLQARLKRIRFMGNRQPEDWNKAVSEHEEMADSLKNRDGQRLGDIMALHLANTWERVRNRL